MLKLILLFLLVFILIGLGVLGLILRGLFGILFGRRGQSAQGGAGGGGRSGGGFRFGRGPPQARAPEHVRACDVCGVHVPESEGLRAADGFFCCEEHRRVHEEKNKAEAVGR